MMSDPTGDEMLASLPHRWGDPEFRKVLGDLLLERGYGLCGLDSKHSEGYAGSFSRPARWLSQDQRWGLIQHLLHVYWYNLDHNGSRPNQVPVWYFPPKPAHYDEGFLERITVDYFPRWNKRGPSSYPMAWESSFQKLMFALARRYAEHLDPNPRHNPPRQSITTKNIRSWGKWILQISHCHDRAPHSGWWMLSEHHRREFSREFLRVCYVYYLSTTPSPQA